MLLSKTHIRTCFGIFGLLLFLSACHDETPQIEDPCEGKFAGSAKFGTFEAWHDTIFQTDTLYTSKEVIFKALDNYDEVVWKIGTDDRAFDYPSFLLYFFDETPNQSINIQFTGINHHPDTLCFPNDTGIYEASSAFTLVERDSRYGNHTLSPLIGSYRMASVNDPTDTFTVRMDFFDSLKYNAAITGSKNFYFFSDFPGNVDTTSTRATNYPECRYGQNTAVGYRSFISFAGPMSLDLLGWLGDDRDSLYLREDFLDEETFELVKRYYKGVRVK